MIKSIFLAVDGSLFTNAVVEYGIDLAKKLDAFLRVYSVIDIRIYEWVLNTGGEGYMPVIPSNVFHDESYKFHSERAEVLIDTLRKKLKDSGIKFEADGEGGMGIVYLADEIIGEITSRLSGLSGLGVIARSSAMQYKNTTKSIKQIGELSDFADKTAEELFFGQISRGQRLFAYFLVGQKVGRRRQTSRGLDFLVLFDQVGDPPIFLAGKKDIKKLVPSFVWCI